MDFVGLLRATTKLYFARFQPGCLDCAPWGEEEYDCFVLNRSPLLTSIEMDQIAIEVAGGRNDWVQTLGRGSEKMHDAIDEASVRMGRQAAIGDGYPMTSWHEDVITLDEMVDFVLRGSLGGSSDYLVALIVGSDQEYSEALRIAKPKISARWLGNQLRE